MSCIWPQPEQTLVLCANRGWTYKKAPVISALYSTCVLNIRIPASPTERPIAGRPLDVQVFNSDDAEFSRFAMTELVNGILPNICNPSMEFGKFGFRMS